MIQAVAVLLAKASPRARLLLAVTTLLATAARGSVMVAALFVARSDAKGAGAFALLAAGLYALERVFAAAARVRVEADLHRMTARALLEGDVLSVPALDLSRIVYDGGFHSLQLLTGIWPALVADALASIAGLPIVFATLPARLVALAATALVIVLVGMALVRRTTQRLEEGARDAYLTISDTLAAALEGRLEVVARGAEDELLERLEGQLRTYERVSVRAAYGTAILGRAPIAAAVAVVGGAVFADTTSRALLATSVLTHALVLAATVRPLITAVMGVHGTMRTMSFVGLFVRLLTGLPRADVAQRGGTQLERLAPIEAERLSFAYEATPPVISELEFSWSGDEPLLLLGPNGSGKSTLLRLLLGLRPPTSGALRVAGHDLGSVDLRALRRSVAYLPQRAYLGEPHVTVHAAMRLVRSDVTDDAMRRVLARTGVAHLLSSSVGELSAGQRQRVALARILLQESAKVVLLDEPDANLDREGIAMVASLVSELTAAGKRVVVVAHTTELTTISSKRVQFE